MFRHVDGHEVSRNDSVKIRCHPSFTTDDIRPTTRKKPDMIIIHTGTNDIQNKVNTLQKVRKVITTIKETDVNDDQDFEEEINEINRKLENWWKDKGIKFIDNNNIDGTCLNSGTALLVKSFSQALKPNWW